MYELRTERRYSGHHRHSALGQTAPGQGVLIQVAPGLSDLVKVWSKASNSASGHHEMRWQDTTGQTYHLSIERKWATAPCHWTLKVTSDEDLRHYTGDSVSRLWELYTAISV